MNTHWSQPSTDMHFVSSAWSRLSVMSVSVVSLRLAVLSSRVCAKVHSSMCASWVLKSGVLRTCGSHNERFLGVWGLLQSTAYVLPSCGAQYTYVVQILFESSHHISWILKLMFTKTQIKVYVYEAAGVQGLIAIHIQVSVVRDCSRPRVLSSPVPYIIKNSLCLFQVRSSTRIPACCGTEVRS